MVATPINRVANALLVEKKNSVVAVVMFLVFMTVSLASRVLYTLALTNYIQTPCPYAKKFCQLSVIQLNGSNGLSLKSSNSKHCDTSMTQNTMSARVSLWHMHDKCWNFEPTIHWCLNYMWGMCNPTATQGYLNNYLTVMAREGNRQKPSSTQPFGFCYV